MKKATITLWIILILTLMVSSAFAANVAKIGEQEYATLEEAVQAAIVDFDDSNTLKSSSGADVALTADNCNAGDAEWDEARVVAFHAKKDQKGKYTSGKFVGTQQAVLNVLADGVPYVGGGNEYMAGDAIPVAAVVKSASHPKTGDSSPIVLWAGLMLISAIYMTVFGKKRSA